MKKVSIRQCPDCSAIRGHAGSLAEALQTYPRIETELIDGSRGELTVAIDGHVIAQTGKSLPKIYEVLAVVRKLEPTAAR